MTDRPTGGPFDGQHAWVVVLVRKTRTGSRHAAAQSFGITRAATGDQAIAAVYPEGSPVLSSKKVVGAVAFRLDPDFRNGGHVTANLEVDRPKWGTPQQGGWGQ